MSGYPFFLRLWYNSGDIFDLQEAIMNIVMLEPLLVPRDFLFELGGPLKMAGHTFIPCTAPLDVAEKKERIQEADIVIIGSSPLGAEVLREARRLAFISVAFTGTDHLDKTTCRDMGIRVSNASGYSTLDVAELTVGMMISLLRGMQAADARTRAGGTKEGLPAQRLHGKTVGILGTGAIGLRVAELLKAFGCRVIAHSRTQSARTENLGITYVPLDTLLTESDILTLHTPLTEQTRHMINRERLAMMKQGAYLINCARGPVVDAAALADALNSGHLAGAAIDVFDTEPPLPGDNPLLDAKNTLLTPHIAYYTAESMKDRTIIAFDNITKYLNGTIVREIALD
jgi:D-3-phosphoglycerate dehydrogenase